MINAEKISCTEKHKKGTLDRLLLLQFKCSLLEKKNYLHNTEEKQLKLFVQSFLLKEALKFFSNKSFLKGLKGKICSLQTFYF